MTIAPKTLAWLRQAAHAGQVEPQALLHLLERVEALEQRPIPGVVELAAPAPDAAPPPVATDEELADCYADAAKVAILNRRDYDKALTPVDMLKAQIRAIYNLGRQHGAAQHPAPAGGLVEMVAELREQFEQLIKCSRAYDGYSTMTPVELADRLIDAVLKLEADR